MRRIIRRILSLLRRDPWGPIPTYCETHQRHALKQARRAVAASASAADKAEAQLARRINFRREKSTQFHTNYPA